MSTLAIVEAVEVFGDLMGSPGRAPKDAVQVSKDEFYSLLKCVDIRKKRDREYLECRLAHNGDHFSSFRYADGTYWVSRKFLNEYTA